VAIAAFGTKPPLSQNLGIPPSELIIDPYLAHGPCNYGDIYLICSDGLTDMLSIGEITEILSSGSIVQAASQLMEQALDHGGKDNTTIILCEIQRRSGWFDKWIRPITGKEV
jgi:protein phosphatase